jgi:thioredoxin 1
MPFDPEYSEVAPSIEQINSMSGDVVLEFGAPWCGHCKAATPAIEEMLNKASSIQHIRVYDGKGKRLGRAFQVKLWPTLIAVRNGKELARIVRPIDIAELQPMLDAFK